MHNVFLFNPTGELAIANGTHSYTPPKRLQIFEEDLSFLTSFFAQENDYIITNQNTDSHHYDKWQELGLGKLQYVSMQEINNLSIINSLNPWSWNQVSHYKFKDLKDKCSAIFKSSPNYNWTPAHKLFFSRQTTNDVQKIIAQNYTSDIIYIPVPAVSYNNYDDLNEWLINIPKAILKLPWSSSGRGIQVIDKTRNKPVNVDWIKGSIRQQGFITAEPLLNKQDDFSFQFFAKRNGEIDFKGISYSINDSKGHFTGGNIHQTKLRQKINTYLTNNTIDHIAEILIKAIKQISPQQFYEGPFGIDAIAYLNKDENIKIHPCVDINWRYNMGILNLILPGFVYENSTGHWQIGSFNENEWNTFISEKSKNNPLRINHYKIEKGFIPLTPVNTNARFGAWMEIEHC